MQKFLNYFFSKIYEISGLKELDYSHFIFYFSTLLSAFLIELIFVGWKKSSLKCIVSFNKTTRTDVICWILDFFNLFNFIGILLSFGICYYLVGLIQKKFHFNLILLIANPYLQFFIVLIVSDLKNYVRHSIFHNIKPLWRLHEFHHSSTELNIITTHRSHFLEASLSSFISVIPFIILGTPVQSFIIIVSLREVHQLLLHSSIQSDWGIIGKYILVSPAAHWIHHSVENKHHQKNLGGIFIFWDRLFGTYHPSEKVNKIGIPDNPYNQRGFANDILTGLKRFIEAFPKNKIFNIKKEATIQKLSQK